MLTLISGCVCRNSWYFYCCICYFPQFRKYLSILSYAVVRVININLGVKLSDKLFNLLYDFYLEYLKIEILQPFESLPIPFNSYDLIRICIFYVRNQTLSLISLAILDMHMLMQVTTVYYFKVHCHIQTYKMRSDIPIKI